MAETEETTTQISATPSAAKKKAKKSKSQKEKAKAGTGGGKHGPLAYPKHALTKCLRIPQAVLDQNAGKECSDREAAKFAGIGWSGQIQVEISSAIKYGLFSRPSAGRVEPTDITRRITRPQKSTDKVDAMREAVLRAPLISDM